MHFRLFRNTEHFMLMILKGEVKLETRACTITSTYKMDMWVSVFISLQSKDMFCPLNTDFTVLFPTSAVCCISYYYDKTLYFIKILVANIHCVLLNMVPLID